MSSLTLGYRTAPETGWQRASRTTIVRAMPAQDTQPLTMTIADWTLLIVLSVLWGGSFFFAKIVLFELPPLTVALGRVALAAAILVLLARATGTALPLRRSAWLRFVPLGLFNNALPFVLIFWGQTHIASGLAAILNATTPLFTVLVAHVATADDKLTRARFAGLVSGFIGVVIMIGPDLRDLGVHVGAQLACLVAALSYAVSGVYGRRLRGEGALTIATGQLVVSTIILAPVALIVDRPWTLALPGPAAWAALIALAALSTALGYLIYFRVLARAGATNVLLVTFLIPVSAILLGTLVLGEEIAARHFAGMAAIALGLAAIDGRPARLLTNAMRPN